MANVKTNAVRLLDLKKVDYILYEYDAPEGFLDGVSVARATGIDPERVFKTLVTQGASKEFYVCNAWNFSCYQYYSNYSYVHNERTKYACKKDNVFGCYSYT